MLADCRRAGAASRTRRCSTRLPAHGAPRACWLDADGRRDRAAARDARPPPRSTAEQPRLRHLHLGLDRHAQGRDGRAPQPCQPLRCATHFDVGLRRPDRVCCHSLVASTSRSASCWCLLLGGARWSSPSTARRDLRPQSGEHVGAHRRDCINCTRRRYLRPCWSRRLRGLGIADALILGGEALAGAHCGRHLARHCRDRLLDEHYGPTETHHRTHRLRSRGGSTPARPSRSAGRSPTRASTCWTAAWSRCLSACRRAVHRGRGLARGYLDRAGADRRAVRRRPVRRRRAAGCTAPATWRAGAADGALEFLGRADTR